MYTGYEIIKEEEISDISSKGVLLKHKKTGARVALLINDDNNKVFDIAFRTPPSDSTGVAHIIEHTVLCGSKKFPLKDPFVELAKGSLNTFLNAMTFPDKTMYPVASCNDADFKNLMEVYLDSVFFPNIYNTEKIFEQEGWHYEMRSADEPLRINGVVYNEMKGVYSSADAVLENTVLSNLFPDTTYGLESGGDPDVIPKLTYNQYLDFHRAYYHPSNSYIFLYGNSDMEERLKWLDKEYLSKFEKREVDSAIEYQSGFERAKTVRGVYPVLDGEPLKENTYLNMSVVTGDFSDVMTNVAMNVLTYVLLDAPGAPLKKALIDAGVGKDVSGAFTDGILQPYFSVDVKYANASDAPKFKRVIKETLNKLADEGLDEKALRAAIHYYEFRFREADYSVYPKGLIYILGAFDSWLYDENSPFDSLKQLKVYDELKKKIGTGYFEDLIRERILDNNHKVYTILRPQKNLAAKREKALAQELQEYKASLSKRAVSKIVKETAELEKYQNRADTPEAVASLPVLSISDIDKKTPVKLNTRRYDVDGVSVLHHKYESNGISYLNLMFAVDDIPNELLPYMSLLSSVLGYVNTKNYGYSELSNEINARTGGIECGLGAYALKDGSAKHFFTVKSKYLDSECSFALDMIGEIINTSKPDDLKRLAEIIISKKAYMQEYIPAAGHLSAVSKAAAGLSEVDDWQERASGISYYRFIEGLFASFDEAGPDVPKKLARLMKHIFRADNLIASVTGGSTALKEIRAGLPKFTASLKGRAGRLKKKASFKAHEVHDAVMTAGQVQYVASVGNFKDAGFKYTGALNVLRTMLNYEYLWKNLRERGGAYGCMSGFKRTGDAYLVSYRDPQLVNTLEVYGKLADYLESYDADEKAIAKFIIGTISTMDTPMNARANGETALNAYFAGLKERDFQKDRDEVLSATAEDIRSLAPLVRSCFDGKHVCVVGSEAAISNAEDLFDSIEPLVQA